MRISASQVRDLVRGSELEGIFARQILARRYPIPEREYRFARDHFRTKTGRPRQWRFDFAWPSDFVAVEVDGGTFSRGRHTRGKGYQEDARKLNAAARLGWFVLRGDSEMVRSGELADALGEILESRGA